jgi:S-adenosylmethionine:diacylglycerol 3-amino-3-carboxypropyl transferase
MEPIYNFGISQEDALTEFQALGIKKNDRLLCIASAGEVPLNLLAMEDIFVEAVDISLSQLFLSRLKLHSICALDALEAAAFLGFMESVPENRIKLFQRVLPLMEEEEKRFWLRNRMAIEEGPIRVARFERFVSKLSSIGLMILGKRKLLRLFDLETIEEQQEFFDRYLSTFWLSAIFKIAFHPRVYKKRGMASDGLRHCGARNIADFFYSRFKHFCSSTLARKNYYLQYTFFNRVLFPEALPEYLSGDGMARIRRNRQNVIWRLVCYTEAVQKSRKRAFNKFHLSNIGDWMSREEYAELLISIKKKGGFPSKVFARYIHLNHEIPRELKNCFIVNHGLGEELVKKDRFPFYSLVPMDIITS